MGGFGFLFIIIAFAVTRRIANTTAMPIVPMSSFTFPHMLANPDANAFSVPVFVGAFELRNWSSMVLATVGAAVGSSICMMNQPGVTRSGYFS